MREALLDMIGDLPRDASGPVFREPWEAEAFALTLALYDKGVFSWAEWTEALSQEIKAAGAGDYYDHWLHALEHLVVQKQVTTQDRLYEVRDAWERAAHATPHGEPIDLANDPLMDHSHD